MIRGCYLEEIKYRAIEIFCDKQQLINLSKKFPLFFMSLLVVYFYSELEK